MFINIDSTNQNTDSLENRSLSRELSEFLKNSLDNTCVKLDSEKTVDISSIVLEEQYNKEMTNIISNSQNTTYSNDSTYRNDHNDSDELTREYDEFTSNGKRKAAYIGNDRNKRLSTTSTTSSSTGDNFTTVSGRRGGRRGVRVNSLLKTNTDEDESTARFGNKVVIKGTEEYNDRRNKNNDAVKKCRAKLQQKQNEREQRLKELTEENRKLSNQVDSLNKELNVLKGILATMKPQCMMPNEIEEKIKKLESMILANSINNNSSLK